MKGKESETRGKESKREEWGVILRRDIEGVCKRKNNTRNGYRRGNEGQVGDEKRRRVKSPKLGNGKGERAEVRWL